jgi:uncharacterized OB-fold protein
MSDEVGNEGYDELIDAIAEGEGYYLDCPEGHGSLPPRRICPYCGQTDLERTPLPESGAIETFTQTSVPTPQFEDDAPYVLAIASFGPVRLTGQVRGRNPGEISVGTAVTADAVDRETTGEPLLVFRAE